MFVGSSSESEELIRGLSLNLDGKVEVHNWKTIPWAPSRSTLTGIERAIDGVDFAAFILSGDDTAMIRGEEEHVVRDNVLFELGVSFGRIGRDRTFMLAPHDSDSRTASDILGLTSIGYEPGAKPLSVMANPAARLWEHMQERGPRDRTGGVGSANGTLKRGDTTYIDVIADGALYVRESRDTYVDELRKAVFKGRKVPAKFQFAEADGGRHWLNLCRSANYRYFNRAKAHLGDNAARLVDKVRDATDTAAVDLISLGSGDGSKDDIILHELTARLSDHEYVYYYPVDISDILLVEAVRHVSMRGLARSRFRCKPVLGDFTDLPSLRGIIEHRPNPNLFSVLGNALGSFDESDILTSIAGAMLPGDLVLLEANIGDPDDSVALLEDHAASQWDLSTLDALDIPRDSCDLEQEGRTGLSVVPDTRTLVSYAVPRENGKSRYMLSAMHHYDFEKLKVTMREKLDVELIDDIPGEGVCLLLGQRQG